MVKSSGSCRIGAPNPGAGCSLGLGHQAGAVAAAVDLAVVVRGGVEPHRDPDGCPGVGAGEKGRELAASTPRTHKPRSTQNTNNTHARRHSMHMHKHTKHTHTLRTGRSTIACIHVHMHVNVPKHAHANLCKRAIPFQSSELEACIIPSLQNLIIYL